MEELLELINTLYTSFLNLEYLDQILLLVLIFSLLCKGMGEFICWIISKNFNRDKTYKQPCIYLDSQREHDCKLLKCKSEYFINECCDKKNCPGYRTSDYSIEEIKSISKWPFVILTFVKWISDLSAVILIIRTLLNSTIS